MSFDSSSEYVIEVEGLSKCYQIYENPSDRLKQMFFRGKRQYFKEFWALRNVTFKIKKGQTVGIIGRNGSGKSTLLQIICGTLNPTVGKVKVNGRVAALLELGAGFNPEFSGVDNIYMAASLYGLTRLEIDQRFDAIKAFADIGEHINQPVKTYSSGMYVRLAFAVIAHVDADILVIDEALAVGDAFFTQKCMRFLRAFMQTGTVLFVSHDTASIKNLCQLALWLENGEIQKEGTPKNICESYLEAFYESQQGKSTTIKSKKIKNNEEIIRVVDQRLSVINNSNLRNDIQVFGFDPQAASFGKGGAWIASVKILNNQGDQLSWMVGGEYVAVQIDVESIIYMHNPIVGFFVKDRLGQTLFGDNTYMAYESAPVEVHPGKTLRATFEFYMPILPHGDYSIAIAVANGTQKNHEQLHWVHDAILFKSETSSVATGLVGIPMHEINMKLI